MHAVAGAGALDRPDGGIAIGDGGLSTVFMSKGEREQVTLKRQWQEMEHLLQELDFVARARVTTSGGTRTPFGGSQPKTGSVMLLLRRPDVLGRDQAKTVANLVRFGLGIEPRHLNISDQSGNSLYDGTELDEHGANASDWLEQKRLFERDLEERANEVLAAVLGPNKARVAVSSTWNNDLNTTVKESADPGSKVVVSETTSTSKVPQGSAPTVGGPAGAGSNTGAFGTDTAGVPEGEATATDQVAKTDNTSKRYWTPHETQRTVSIAPKLERLSISLFLDESLSTQETSLAENVKAAVGFDETRSDAFSTVILPLYAPPEEEGEGGEEAAPSGLSPMVTTLLERGIEIVSALVFLFLLAKALKGAKNASVADSKGDEDSEDALERLAQAQIEELVKSDPERVGEILSSWAREEKAAAG
jgi:flagellar M-ring protein FliF